MKFLVRKRASFADHLEESPSEGVCGQQKSDAFLHVFSLYLSVNLYGQISKLSP